MYHEASTWEKTWKQKNYILGVRNTSDKQYVAYDCDLAMIFFFFGLPNALL